MGFRGRLEITDGTTFIDLLGNSGGSKSIFGLLEWEPASPDVKSGGIWMDNPLLDGRELAIRKEGNIIETFSIIAKGQTATDVLNAITKLRYMLNRAVGYWTNRAKYPDPIYILIQYPEESEPFWALIYDYRLPQLTNPYVQPLYGKKVASIPEFTLVIERGYRKLVDGFQCADLDFVKTWWELSDNDYVPTGGTDDCNVNLTDGTISLVSAAAIFGLNPVDGDRWGIGVRFRNVTIPAGARILSAFLDMDPSQTILSAIPDLTIKGEKNVTPAVFSTYANYAARARTDAERLLAGELDYGSTWYAGVNEEVPLYNDGIEDIITEIIGLPGWASGNDLVIFIEPTDPTVGYRWAAMLEHAVYAPITLTVQFNDNPREQTIDNNACGFLPITNQMKFSQIDHVTKYSATGAAYSSLDGTALPWDLMDDVAINSALYIACDLSRAEGFYSIVLNLTSIFDPDTVTIVWEYRSSAGGGTWVSCVDLIDGSNGFTVAGQSVVHWTPQLDWATVAVNGVTAYWVRARISAVPGVSATTPFHDDVNNNLILTPGFPYVDLRISPLLIAPTDVPLPLKFTIAPIGCGQTEADYTVDEVWICSRQVSRGFDFTPFLNVNATYNYTRPLGVTVTDIGGAIADLESSPSQAGYWYQPGGASVESDQFSINFDGVGAPKYAGKFRVLLRRVEYNSGTPENVQYRLTITADAAGLTPFFFQTDLVVDTATPGYSVVDFGVVNIPANLAGFKIIISALSTGAAEVYLTDVIMLPVDEVCVRAYQRIDDTVTSWIQVYDNYQIVVGYIDGTTQAWIQAGGRVVMPMIVEANGVLQVDTNRDYRFWFFAGTYTSDCDQYKRKYWPGLDLNVKLEHEFIKI